MEYWQAILLAVLEGITEYLPISSTAHLMWGSDMMGVASSEFAKTFMISIQLGAIMAVMSLYTKKVWGNWKLIKQIAIAFTPAGIAGLVLYKLIKGFLLGNSQIAIGVMFLGGVFIIVYEKYFGKRKGTKKIEELSTMQCLAVGLAQAIALIPGVSRAAAAIYGGREAGLEKNEAVKMSFLLAVPTLAAATGWDLINSFGLLVKGQSILLIVGGGVAWIVAMVAVKWLVEEVKSRGLMIFGWYRIGFALVWWISDRWLHG